MSNNLINLMKPKNHKKGQSNISFKDIKPKITKLKIENKDAWIRLYRTITPADLEKLTSIYMEKLEVYLTRPCNLKRLKLILNIIETTAYTDECNLVGGNVNYLIEGADISSDYAKELVLSVIKTFAICAVLNNSGTSTSTTMQVPLTYLREMQISYDDDYDCTASLLKLLERTIPTFENLIVHMNKQDLEFTQLLLAFIIEPEMINKQEHLSEYVGAMSLLSDQMSMQEIITIIQNITNKETVYNTDTKLPELLIE